MKDYIPKTMRIFVPAHVRLYEPEFVAGMQIIRYSGEWNPYPYKTPFLIKFSLVLSIIAVGLNLTVIFLSMMK